MSSFKQLIAKGEKVETAIKFILEAVRAGRITKNDAEDFAEKLHDHVKGLFIQAQEANRNMELGSREMKKILEDFFNVKAHLLSSKEIVDAFVRALRDADIKNGAGIAGDIEKACYQDVSGSRAAGKGYQKIIAGLPETIYTIPNLRKWPTGTVPVASDQGNDPVCTSHAVGKGVVGILDNCGFDVVGGQDNVINDLIKQVQPKLQRENPDRFNGEILNLSIKQKQDRNTVDVAVKINIQTDEASSPEPRINATVRKEKKIHMIVRARYPHGDNHALYAEDYQNNKYSCINSWDTRDPNPKIGKADVYAVDYMQITEGDPQ